MFRSMDAEKKALLRRIWQLVYFMRGGLQYPDALQLTYVEREMAEDLITERLKIEAPKMHPNY